MGRKIRNENVEEQQFQRPLQLGSEKTGLFFCSTEIEELLSESGNYLVLGKNLLVSFFPSRSR
jgi:hypothetical protein